MAFSNSNFICWKCWNHILCQQAKMYADQIMTIFFFSLFWSSTTYCIFFYFYIPGSGSSAFSWDKLNFRLNNYIKYGKKGNTILLAMCDNHRIMKKRRRKKEHFLIALFHVFSVWYSRTHRTEWPGQKPRVCNASWYQRRRSRGTELRPLIWSSTLLKSSNQSYSACHPWTNKLTILFN